jgi:cold shock CspA family protein
MNEKNITVRIRGRERFLKVGDNYFFEFKDPEETSFHMLKSEIIDIYWKDNDSGKSFFFIYVHEHNEDYLISDDEIVSAKLSDLVAGQEYKFIMDNGSSITGEYIELKSIGKEIHSIWIDLGRQPVYLDYRDIAEIIKLDNDY